MGRYNWVVVYHLHKDRTLIQHRLVYVIEKPDVTCHVTPKAWPFGGGAVTLLQSPVKGLIESIK